MSKTLYLDVCQELSRLLTMRYSTSFSLGIRVFPRECREAIFSIYGFVRLADEIVDTFHDVDKATLLQKLTEDTFAAIRDGISTNPILHAFQFTARKYQLDPAHIQAFLRSMEMDLTMTRFNRRDYEEYIYGSAEVVGLMCLKVFCWPDEALYRRLVDPARKLGSAFQKVNFLRDVKSDLEERGRIYLSDVSSQEDMTEDCKKRMEEEIAVEFAEALSGIKQLPKVSQLAVYSVYLYYQALFTQLKKRELNEILAERVRVANFYKAFLLLRAFFAVRFW